jgi:hypothetical protein
MSNGVAKQTAPSLKIGQSVAALAVGFVVNVALSLGTDIGLHAMGIMPALDQPWSNAQLLGATAYRALYGIFSAYLVARLAPRRPLEHALIGGAIGMVLGTAGAAATWTRGLGPHWYPVALIVLALPTAWVGGKLRTAQVR